MIKTNKLIGIGSLSLLLCVIGILFSFSFGNQGSYGDKILEYIGLNSWSNIDTGIHYTVFYSLIFFVPSFILGYKFKNNIGAKVGRVLSLVMIILIVIVGISFISI